MSNSKAKQERAARLREVQQQQNSQKNRTVAIVAVVALVAALGIGAVVWYAAADYQKSQLGALGASAAAASCDAVTTDASTGEADHVSDDTVVDYETVPPSSGKHFGSPEVSTRRIFTVEDRPRVETLVHNLEHGYSILWYDAAAGSSKTQLIEDVVDKANKEKGSGGRLMAVPWDSAYGALPDGKPWALVHWSAQAGHRQLCGDLSGEVVKKFVNTYTVLDAPEAGAA